MVFLAQNEIFGTQSDQNIEFLNKIVNKEFEIIRKTIYDFKTEQSEFRVSFFHLVDTMKSFFDSISKEDKIIQCSLINKNVEEMYSNIKTMDKQNKNALTKIYHAIHNNTEERIKKIEETQMIILQKMNEIFDLINQKN